MVINLSARPTPLTVLTVILLIIRRIKMHSVTLAMAPRYSYPKLIKKNNLEIPNPKQYTWALFIINYDKAKKKIVVFPMTRPTLPIDRRP